MKMSTATDTNEAMESAYQAICAFRSSIKSREVKIKQVVASDTVAAGWLTLFICGGSIMVCMTHLLLGWFLIFILLMACLLSVMVFWANKEHKFGKMLEHEYQSAKYTVLHSHNPDAIPALLELMQTEDNKAYVTQALIRLLPELDSQHVNVIGARQYRVLYDLLRHSYVLELRITIVNALGKIGNQDTLRVLDTIAKEPELLQPLMEAIQQCRNTITEREQQAQSQQMLLRASENIRPPETLLRAAQPVSQTLSDNLLRPNYSDRDVEQVQQQGRKER